MKIKFKFFHLLSMLVIIGVLISSCTPTQSTQTNSADDPPELSNDPNPESESLEDQETDLPTQEIATTSETNSTPSGPTPTPIVETRLPPERWQEWPVVPELTGREQAIYQLGQELGNDPHSFSKVGDCQAIKDVLLGIYDKPDRYFLTESDAYLQETIAHFAGSFDRDGQAVRGGYNAAAVLSPVWADPEVCNPGETPIECEYRIHRPSFVIISLEVWWEGRTVERYEEYMRQIIDFYIENGVVPILSTKADNVEGDHRINLATARIAYDYHIPLWNFWLAVQYLPNHGIDPARDGFHISYEAWTDRSYTALQALDAVWRGSRVTQSEDEIVVSPTPTEQPVTFSDILFTPIPMTTPPAIEGEHLIFSITQRALDENQLQGIYTYDLDNFALYQLLESGYEIEDIKADGSSMLISNGQKLIVSDSNGENLQQITDKLALTSRNASAFWLPDDAQLVLLTDEGQENVLWLVDLDQDVWENLSKGDITGIVKPTQGDAIYWYQGECHSDTTCDDVSLWRVQADQSEVLIAKNRVVFSTNGEKFAWVETTAENSLILYTRNADNSNQDFLYLPGNRLVDIAWSPSSNLLALLSVTRSEYSGKSSDAAIYIVNTNTLVHNQYMAFPGLNPGLIWHPDGNALLLTSTLPTENGFQTNIAKLDLSTGLFTFLNDQLNIQSENFITINDLFWIDF